MNIKHIKENTYTIANLVTLIRFFAIFPIIYFYSEINSQQAAATFFIFSCLLDIVDGFLARALNQVTTFGKLFDPIVDKLSLFIAMSLLINKYPWLKEIIILMSIKEFLQLVYISIVFFLEKKAMGAKWCGKLCTFFLDSVTAFLLYNANCSEQLTAVLKLSCIFTIITATILYSQYYCNIIINISGRAHSSFYLNKLQERRKSL